MNLILIKCTSEHEIVYNPKSFFKAKITKFSVHKVLTMGFGAQQKVKVSIFDANINIYFLAAM